MKYDDYMINDKYMKDEDMLEDCEEGEMDYDYTCDDQYKKAPKKKMIEVEEVLGIGSADTTVEICIPLRPPAFEVVEELITKEVIFDALVAANGKVFVNGRVIKDIPYKTRCRTTVPGCETVSRLTYGNLRHVTAEIPFALCIDVPEAFKGAKVVVLDYEVNSIEIPNRTNCIPGKCIPQCEPFAMKVDPCFKRPFCSLTEKDCIFVKVKVVKDVIIKIPAKDFDY